MTSNPTELLGNAGATGRLYELRRTSAGPFRNRCSNLGSTFVPTSESVIASTWHLGHRFARSSGCWPVKDSTRSERILRQWRRTIHGSRRVPACCPG